MDSEPLSVVALGPEYWRDLKAIRLEAFQTEPEAFSTTYAEAAVRPDDYWRGRLADDQTVHLLARDRGRQIGMVGGYLGDDDGDQSVAVVFGMYVNAAYRRRGVGRLLLRSLIDRLSAQPGVATIRLWVGEAQHPARRLYESLGFRIAGPSQEPDSNELIMELRVR